MRAPGAGFALVLMDIQMPDVDGLEATRRLREAGYTGPVVALSANTQAEDRARAAEAGMDGFLSKPIDSSALEQVLAAARGVDPQPPGGA